MKKPLTDNAIVVNVSQQIAKPVADVFEAIVNPNHMVNYFVTEASGPMEKGANLCLTFGDVGVSCDIKVIGIKKNEQITFTWPTGEKDTTVNISLLAIDDNLTEVTANESGWDLDEDGVKKALGQTQGWTDMLLCLKAYLEFNINLRRGLKLSTNC